MTSEINIFRDPPSQAEIDANRRADSRRMTTGEKIAYGPGVLCLEVIVGFAVDAFKGELITGTKSAWETAPGAVDWDWSKSMFAQSYAEKVRAMKRELAQCEVAALTRQINAEEKALSTVKDAGKIAGNVAGAIISG